MDSLYAPAPLMRENQVGVNNIQDKIVAGMVHLAAYLVSRTLHNITKLYKLVLRLEKIPHK